MKNKTKQVAKILLTNLLKKYGAKQLIETNTHINRMEIRSESSNRLYIISQRVKKDGDIVNECSCPGWIFKRNCKHLTAMAPLFAELEQQARPKLKAANKNKIEHKEKTLSTPKSKTPKRKLKTTQTLTGSTAKVTADEKDVKRILDIITKADGDNDKILNLCLRMAGSIKEVAKAQRRAVAAKELLPKAVAKKAYDIFWRE